jgi:hypothetical protein
MRSDEYFRLHAACLAMAKQSANADVQARWLAMAEIWLKRATEQDERLLSVRGPLTKQSVLPNTSAFTPQQRP